jgi:hypothetical protein
VKREENFTEAILLAIRYAQKRKYDEYTSEIIFAQDATKKKYTQQDSGEKRRDKIARRTTKIEVD